MITDENKEFLLKTFNINVDDYDYEKLNSLLDNILASIYTQLEENKRKLQLLSNEFLDMTIIKS